MRPITPFLKAGMYIAESGLLKLHGGKLMPVESIFGSTINLLGKTIDLRAQQQNITSSNIANAETPNYVPKSLTFEDELRGALKHGSKGSQMLANPRHIPLKGAAS